MKKMLILSMAFHTAVAMTILIAPSPSQRVLFLPPIYQVDLVTLPAPPPSPVAEEIKPPSEPQAPPALPQVKKKPPPPKVEKPKTVTKRMPEPKQAPRGLASKEVVIAPPKTPRMEDASKSQGATASVPTITAAVEAPDFKFPEYTEKIRWKIGSVWSPPPIEIGNESKEVVISFILMTTGKIQEIQVEKGSGNPFLDQAALRAVYSANPLPPFPRGFREPHLKVHFSFTLRKG